MKRAALTADRAHELSEDVADRKRQATLVAKAALAGIAVTAQADGTYLMRRWAFCREVASLDELERTLRMQGVAT